MARTITGAQRTQLASRRAAHFLRVEVQDAVGNWRDLRAIGGADYQLGATVAQTLDAPTTTATVTLRAGRGAASIAPGLTLASANASGRLLDVGRGCRIDVAVLAPGSTPGAGDWVRLFDGRIDTLSQSKAGDVLTLRARDQLVPVLDAMVETAGTITGGAAESILQNMLNAVLSSPPTIVTPVSPAYNIATVPPLVPGQLLWTRMTEIVDRLGWVLRYRWNGNTPELRLFGPVRQPTAGDVSFAWAASELRALESVDLDLTPVRNRVHVDWRLNGVTQRTTAFNGTSQTLYGTRSIVIREEAPPRSPIDNSTAAQRFADAVLADLQAPPLAYRATHVHCFWPVEVGDVLDVAPDGVAFDATQRLGVVSVEHVLDEGGGRTTVGLRGAPASRGRAWLSLGGAGGPEATDPTSASASFTSTGAVRINVIGPTDATQVRASVSTSGAPSAADVDAATGSMAANASMASLTSAQSYAVGTTVFVAAAAYVAGVRGRVVQLQIQRDAAAGTVAVGPDLEVRLALSATQGTIEYLADGAVEISEDGGGFVAAPASPFSRPRAAQGSDTVRTVTLAATLNGQRMTNTVIIPARATVDTDTVTPDLRLIRQSAAGGNAAQYVEYQVQATNPKAGGGVPTVVGTWLGTTVERWDGGTWVTMTSGAALFPGDFLRLTRPAYDALPGTFTARATLGAGQGAEEITLEVPPRPSPLPPAVVARISSRTATTITVTVTTEPAGGTVRWLGGTATLASGPAVNTDQPSGTSWTFTRPAINAGDDSAEFRGIVAGVVDEDSVVISEQGRDTIAILTRARVINVGPTSYTVRVSASAPFADRDGTIELTQANGVTVTLDGAARPEGSTDTLTTAGGDGYYGPIGGVAGVSFRDYLVTRPSVGAQPGRVTFRVSAPGLTSDSDSVDVEPQRALTPGRIEVVGSTQPGDGYFVRFRAWTAGGTAITEPTALVVTLTTIPTSGAPTAGNLTPTWDAANAWFFFGLFRGAGVGYAATVALGEQLATGTARTVLPVPIPTYTPPAGTAGPRFTFAAVNFAGPSFDQVELQWGALDMPAGVSYEAMVQVRNIMRRFVGITSGAQIGIGKSVQDGSYPVLTRVTGTLYALDNGQRIAEIGVPETVVYVPTNET